MICGSPTSAALIWWHAAVCHSHTHTVFERRRSPPLIPNRRFIILAAGFLPNLASGASPQTCAEWRRLTQTRGVYMHARSTELSSRLQTMQFYLWPPNANKILSIVLYLIRTLQKHFSLDFTIQLKRFSFLNILDIKR
jgi:hypothetical protein